VTLIKIEASTSVDAPLFILFCRKPSSRDADDDLPTPGSLEPDPGLFELLNVAPWDANQRQQFNNDAVQTFAQTTPDAFRCQHEFHEASRRRTEKRCPLHRIVALGGSLELVQLVCQAWPLALSEATTFDLLPCMRPLPFKHLATVIQQSAHMLNAPTPFR
jgi:hypothetical protein